jgi:glutamine synthetase
MLGSSQSIAGPNIALNTIMAEELSQFADILEEADDFGAALQKLVCDTLTAHQRIIFNGNGYSEEWEKEAAERGLSNLKSTAKALPTYFTEKNINLVTKHGIFTEAEFKARDEIHMEAYNKHINIEARTMVDMVMHQILPAALQYSSDLANSICRKRDAVGTSVRAAAENALLKCLSDTSDALYEKTEQMSRLLASVPKSSEEALQYYCNEIVPQMQAIRECADLLESNTAKSYWPYPKYSDMLYY